MSDVVKRDLYGLIDKELEAANQKFPLFNSTHEAFAVILEEAEEAKEEAGKPLPDRTGKRRRRSRIRIRRTAGSR